MSRDSWFWLIVVIPSLFPLAMFGFLGEDAHRAAEDVVPVYAFAIVVVVFVVIVLEVATR